MGAIIILVWVAVPLTCNFGLQAWHQVAWTRYIITIYITKEGMIPSLVHANWGVPVGIVLSFLFPSFVHALSVKPAGMPLHFT